MSEGNFLSNIFSGVTKGISELTGAFGNLSDGFQTEDIGKIAMPALTAILAFMIGNKIPGGMLTTLPLVALAFFYKDKMFGDNPELAPAPG